MTNKEIAKQLGISPAALSIIINQKTGVSEATRTRVLSELKRMGLENLVKKATPAANPSISFIIYKRNGGILDYHPFFLLLMEHVESRAAKYGYGIMLSTIDRRKPIEPQIERINQQNSLGAIIFATEMLTEDLAAFDQLKIPYVTLDNDFSCLPCNSVAINNRMGTYQAVQHLVDNHHKRIGYLKSTNRISSFDERQEGYEKALDDHRMSFREEDIWSVDYSEEGSYRDIRDKLTSLKSSDYPDAFVCDDDTIAVGAIRAFSEAGLSIPEDVSIIGFNDRPTCELTTPMLTSINVPKATFAMEAVDSLVDILNSESEAALTRSRKVRIGTRLVIRGSVGRPGKRKS